MYWPVGGARQLLAPSPLNKDPIIRLRQNRKGNFFACLTKSGLGVWDVRPTVLQTAIVRSSESLERWGTNQDVFWAHDGRGIIILTSTSHLLFYQLNPTSRPAYTHPHSPLFPSSGPGEGDILMGWTLKPLGSAFIMGTCQTLCAQSHSLLIGIRNPPALLTVPWPVPGHLLAPSDTHFPPPPLDGDGPEQADCEIWDLTQGRDWAGWAGDPPAPRYIGVSKTPGMAAMYTMLTDDGRVWGMHAATRIENATLTSRSSSPAAPQLVVKRSSIYTGVPIYPAVHQIGPSENGLKALGLVEEPEPYQLRTPEDFDKATCTAVNTKFGLIAIGTSSGMVHLITLPSQSALPRSSHVFDLKTSAGLHTSAGGVTSMAWTSDGYALGVGYEHGWAVWSVSGRLCAWGMRIDEDQPGEEGFMSGALDLFWAPGNVDLFVLSHPPSQLYSIPFAKSATTTQHSPDNTQYAFLQMDDRLLVYKGADQPDLSVINPESDVWQHIKIPSDYMSINWPLRYASISTDGTLIAVAGRRGLAHYSTVSGRWKLFQDERQERDFVVRGGLLWFHHVLVAAIEVNKSYQIRLLSRDLELADVNILHSHTLTSPVLAMSLLDNSLLVYTADNTLHHFLIVPTKDTIKMHLCGSISFTGIITVPTRVRALSWLIPDAQKRLGDPIDDLVVATIIFLIDGRLTLLRPRRAGNDEVRYDMQVLADRIESYWTHLYGIGTLENSLWGYDGTGMRVWLDALTIEETRLDMGKDAYESIKESVYLPLDFYPLSILMDKGIVIGVDYEMSTRSLPFNLFKIQTNTHLFLPKFMAYHLSSDNPLSLLRALTFASNYSNIVYFGHSLEILLHSVLDDEDSPETPKQLRTTVEFLDHFPEALDVVVGCARKTEVDRWERLFEVVGSPRELFERCLNLGKLRTAASYLLVLQNLEELDDATDAIRLLRLAIEAKEYLLAKEVLRFLRSIDESGSALRQAMTEVGIAVTSAKDMVPSIEITEPVQTILITDHAATNLSVNPEANVTSDFPLAPAQVDKPHDSDSNLARSVQIRNVERVNSPFQLSSPRIYESPPSPKTVMVGQGKAADEGKIPDVPQVPDETGDSGG